MSSLQVLRADKENATFEDFGVQPGDTLSLLVMLCAIPVAIEDVSFDLSWGYPSKGKDALDGSVFLYASGELIEIVSYRNVWSQCCDAVHHSGDQYLDDKAKEGSQKITVNLKLMEPSINKLFFTLSAFNNSAISLFKQPSLNVYDTRFPDVKLCSDVSEILKEESTEASKKTEAIIMCCLRKSGDIWALYSLKKLSAGYTENYKPLKDSIDEIIESGLV